MGNIRFSELIKQFGKPYATTLWTDPQKDAAFNKAIKENRVVIVKQETGGSKKDFGTIGFNREKNVSYFIFSRALPKLKEAKVIGIKYELLDQPQTKDPISRENVPAKPKVTNQKPQTKEFTARIKRTAVWETTVHFKAVNKVEAKEKAEHAIAEQTFPESEAVVRNEVREIKES